MKGLGKRANGQVTNLFLRKFQWFSTNYPADTLSAWWCCEGTLVGVVVIHAYKLDFKGGRIVNDGQAFAEI